MKRTLFVAWVTTAVFLVGAMVASSRVDAPDRPQTFEQRSSPCPYLMGRDEPSARECPHEGSREGVQAGCPYLKEKPSTGVCPYSGTDATQLKSQPAGRTERNS